MIACSRTPMEACPKLTQILVQTDANAINNDSSQGMRNY